MLVLRWREGESFIRSDLVITEEEIDLLVEMLEISIVEIERRGL